VRRRGPRCSEASFRELLRTARDSIARVQRRMVMLGRNSALEKVSAFLLEMLDRSNARGPHVVCLPMSRYDIADLSGDGC
jgi:CRP/FNR family transcriptional regulator, nitrogen fixation regulation protein